MKNDIKSKKMEKLMMWMEMKIKCEWKWKAHELYNLLDFNILSVIKKLNLKLNYKVKVKS